MRIGITIAASMFALFAIPFLRAQNTDWLNALVASPAEVQEFQVGQAKVRLVVYHETDSASPREGLTIFWLTFPQAQAEMLVEPLIGDSARRGSVDSRLEGSAIPSDIAVLTGGFAGQGCASEGLVIAAGDHGETSLARWIEKNRLIGGMLVSRGLGKLSIERTPDFDATEEIKDRTIRNAIQSKPILVMNDADDRVKDDDPSNRIAVGLTDANEIIIVGAVRSGWTALSLREMVNLLLIPERTHGPGVKSAINLEGAHAQLYIPALKRFFAENSPTCVPTQLHFRTPIPLRRNAKGASKE
jgi:hypothetical protein